MRRAAAALAALFALSVGVSGALPAGAPSAPSGPTGIALSSSVQLAWQSVSGASGYTVYRGTTPTSITTRLTAVGGVPGTTYSDATAANGTTYYYAVTAVAAGVE